LSNKIKNNRRLLRFTQVRDLNKAIGYFCQAILLSPN
jgi:hypothetical protein